MQSEADLIDEYVCPQCQSTEDAMTVLSPLTDKDYEGLRRVLRSLQVRTQTAAEWDVLLCKRYLLSLGVCSDFSSSCVRFFFKKSKQQDLILCKVPPCQLQLNWRYCTVEHLVQHIATS